MFLLGLCWVAATCFAAALPKVKASAAPTQITLGAEFKLAIEAECPEGFSATPISRDIPIAPFEIKNIERSTRTRNENTVERSVLTLTVFEMGDLLVPAVMVEFRDTAGRVYQRYTDPVPIKVVGVKKRPQDKDDVRAIKPPVSYGMLFVWTAAVALVVFLLLLGLAVKVILRKRKHWIDPESLKPAHERAALEWGRLQAKPLLGEGKVKEFYTELSLILKRYLDRRFDAQTFELTTQEVLILAKQLELSSEVVQKIRHVLENSDLVKFAKQIPDRSLADSLAREILEIAEKTKPEPE